MKVAIYTRVSTKDQSCERQIADLIDYARRCEYTVVAIFSEQASGTKCDRAERKAAMKLAKARDIEAILVTELTRWGRSTVDLVSTINDLATWKVSLVAQNGFTVDVSTPHGKMILGIMAALAEFERDLFAERVRSGVALARAKGVKFGRKEGSKDDILRDKIATLKSAGLSIRAIAEQLQCSKSAVERQIKKLQK